MINPKIYLLDVEYAYNGTQAEFGFMGEWYVQLSTTGGKIGRGMEGRVAQGQVEAVVILQ